MHWVTIITSCADHTSSMGLGCSAAGASDDTSADARTMGAADADTSADEGGVDTS